jgi:hypothetical protein
MMAPARRALAWFVRHARALWPGTGILLPLIFVLWPLSFMAAGACRWEHTLVLVGVPLLAYTSPASKRLFLGLLPMGLLGLVYDSMRWLKDVGITPARVHLCDLRAIDMRIASAVVGGERGSVHDWIQLHPSRALDVICSIPYGTFIYVVVGFAILLYARDYSRMRIFGWTFLVVNLAGFVTYHLYPAAPPWYFHAHGCAVDLASRPSEGANLARVDAMLGISYFRSFYARSSDVFGAVPSLHASYPMIIVLAGWPSLGWLGRLLAVGFLTSMCGAAVYLDHHWVVDVLLGLVYAILGFLAVTAAMKMKDRPARRDVAPRRTSEAAP